MNLIIKIIRKLWKQNDDKRDSTISENANVTKIKNIAYLNDADDFNKLDIYYPQGTIKALPTIISIHGGGFIYGTKQTYYHYGTYLASLGFTVVNFNYHLAPEHQFPTILKETVAVINFINDHAKEYFVDPHNLFFVGDSAGGTTLLQLATMYNSKAYASLFDFKLTQEIKIKALAFNCTLFDLTKNDVFNNFLKKQYFGKIDVNDDNRLNPLKFIDSNFAPSYILTSYYDFLKEDAKPVSEYLSKLGVKNVYHLYGDQSAKQLGHVFHVNLNLEEAKVANQDEIAFFKQYID